MIHDDSGQLSIDFIIGFTIFMIAFIFVATMISGLLVGLQSKTIDYDSVAYRTGVILVEDPGWVNEPSDPYNWQDLTLDTANKSKIVRLGLGLSRNYPGILLQKKVDTFFDSAKQPGCDLNDKFCYPGDYDKRMMISGDYIYNFNITIKNITQDPAYYRAIGDPTPRNYGYIHRVVSVKQPSASASVPLFSETNNSTFSNNLTIYFDYSLIEKEPMYQINPDEDNLTFNLSIPGANSTQLMNIWITSEDGINISNFGSGHPNVHLVNNGMAVNLPLTTPITATNNTQIIIDAGYFSNTFQTNPLPINVTMHFSDPATGSVNPFVYNALAHPNFFPAVVEVRIW
jgi:hypothetical protein